MRIDKKVTLGIYVDKNVAREAKELGFNISKHCENCLKEAIDRMKRTCIRTDSQDGCRKENDFGALVGRTGLKPKWGRVHMRTTVHKGSKEFETDSEREFSGSTLNLF